MKKILCLLSFIIITLLLAGCGSDKGCGHLYLTSHVVAPTCDTEGYTLNVCTECQKEFTTDYIPPTGHTITETLFAPTCAESGYTYYSCPCGYSYMADHQPPVGHSYTTVKTDVSCESAGYITYSCSICEHSYMGDFVDATGHDMVETMHLPTKDSVGYIDHSCNNCDAAYRDQFTFYSDVFGSGHTSNTEVLAKGIDVSMWQHSKNADGSYKPLNWVAIKNAGVDFAILKIGSSKSNMDPVFEMNYADARAAGVELGAYFYSYASTEEELLVEIETVLALLDGRKFEYPIYFDLEDPSIGNTENKDMLTKFCFTFIDALRDNGYYGALYSNKDWLELYLHGDTLRSYCDIWYARYPNSENITLEDSFEWNTELYGEQLGMWQYSCSGYIDGSDIAENQPVDFNYCYKDYPSVIKKYGLNGYTAA